MSLQIYPCIWLNNQAKEAADFYCSVFKNSKVLSANPVAAMMEINGKHLMALNGGPEFKINPSISLYVVTQSEIELKEIWKKLVSGGKAIFEINEYPWSKLYGWLIDQFGMTWQLMLDERGDENQKITPSMLFTNSKFGKAEEAIQFYVSIFNNSSAHTLIHYPSGNEYEGKMMFSEFKINDYDIIAMDGPNTPDYEFNEAVSFVVSCDNQEEIDYFWNHLSKGGSEGKCGWLKDPFGVSWQIVPAALGKLMGDSQRSQRVVNAFMKMNKLIIKELEEA